jgi:hypothetical protein
MIKIAQRLHPYSHTPGTLCVLPGSCWSVEVFPTRLNFRHLLTGKEITVRLPFTGAVEDFTVEMDLHRGFVWVFGHAAEGYFRYRLSQESGGILLFFERAWETESRLLVTSKEEGRGAILEELLSLGSHKAQDWDLVCRRKQMEEIFPAWLRLGSCVPPQASAPVVGTLRLIRACQERIEKREVEEIIPAFQRAFAGAFSGILTPRLCDTQFQGLIAEEEIPQGVSPLLLLAEGAKAIRSLFFQQRGEEIALLPSLPPQLHSGRMVSILTEGGDRIDMEWSKKMLRRVVWHPLSDRLVTLHLQKSIKSYRIRYAKQGSKVGLKERGRSVKTPHVLELHKGKTLLLDHFES